MVRHCLFCRGEFPANKTLERFPWARRVAYDPARGRLWAVCAGCHRWTLVPIEQRWEVLEDLERIVTGGAKLLGQTDQVSLFWNGDIEIVRVGRASLREEAWWRYGLDMLVRRDQAKRIVRRGKVREALFSTLLVGFPLWGLHPADRWIDKARLRRFGKLAWVGNATCSECRWSNHALEFEDPLQLVLTDGLSGGLAVRGACKTCAGRQVGGTFDLTGAAADHVLRRMLAYENFAGAPAEIITVATGLVEAQPEASAMALSLAAGNADVKRLEPVQRLALEIAVNEARERDLLQLELKELERRWREEEEIASIVDNELTPAPEKRLRGSREF